MQGLYSLVKFCLVVIYILKIYRKNILFDFIEKKNVQFLNCVFLFKSMYFSSFERFLCWKSRNCSVWFAFYPYFFAFFCFFFFFYRYFPWKTLTFHRIAVNEEVTIIFLVFHVHLLTNIHLVSLDFYHFFLIDLFVITRLITDEVCW